MHGAEPTIHSLTIRSLTASDGTIRRNVRTDAIHMDKEVTMGETTDRHSSTPTASNGGHKGTISPQAERLIEHAHHTAKIYTRRGDRGFSAQLDGSHLSKASAQIRAVGRCDSAQSWLGVVIAGLSPACQELRKPLIDVQRSLYRLQSDLSVPGCRLITSDDTTGLEQQIDAWNDAVPHIPAFILPGGSPTGAALQYARTLVRDAERAIVSFADEQPDRVPTTDKKYINRLSDYLFTMATYANHLDGVKETLSKEESDQPQGVAAEQAGARE